MSRFVNLEFGDEFEQRSTDASSLKDETYYLAQAREAFHNGKFEAGLRAFAKVLEFNPQNAAAWTGQVQMLIELGEFKEAKLWADKALELFPQEADLLAAKAVALARMGDLPAALAFSDAALEEPGMRPYLWVARGDVFLAREEKRARYCFEKAMALAPRDWFICWLVSRVHFFYKRFSLALKFAQQALELDSARAIIWLQLGRCQHALGLVSLAKNSLEQALQLDPGCREAAADLSVVAQAGFWQRLRGWWRQCLST